MSYFVNNVFFDYSMFMSGYHFKLFHKFFVVFSFFSTDSINTHVHNRNNYTHTHLHKNNKKNHQPFSMLSIDVESVLSKKIKIKTPIKLNMKNEKYIFMIQINK